VKGCLVFLATLLKRITKIGMQEWDLTNMPSNQTECELSEHAKLKIEERNLSALEVTSVLKEPVAVFLDVETGYFIATGSASKPNHFLIVVYELRKDKVRVITIIDTTKLELVKRRVEKGRWVKVK